jgi:hypothetical protein
MIAGQNVVWKSLAVVGLLGLLIGVYRFAIRPGQLRWGATPEEFIRWLPGDNLVRANRIWPRRILWLRSD